MVYTLHIQIIYLSAHGSYHEHGISLCDIIASLKYATAFVCTALVTWMYYAIAQKLAVWYRQGSERDIPFKVWLCQVSAFL